MIIRREQKEDYDAIREVVRLAFADHPRSTRNEHRIVDGLRNANALTLAMVAMEGRVLQGFVACSPVTVDGKHCGWVGLGPIAVRPERQRQAVGSRLMRTCIDTLRTMDVPGIVLLGDPAYYGRFGFVASCDLTLPGVPAGYFLSLPLGTNPPRGVVAYHPAFATE